MVAKKRERKTATVHIVAVADNANPQPRHHWCGRRQREPTTSAPLVRSPTTRTHNFGTIVRSQTTRTHNFGTIVRSQTTRTHNFGTAARRLGHQLYTPIALVLTSVLVHTSHYTMVSDHTCSFPVPTSRNPRAFINTLTTDQRPGKGSGRFPTAFLQSHRALSAC